MKHVKKERGRERAARGKESEGEREREREMGACICPDLETILANQNPFVMKFYLDLGKFERVRN